MSLNRLLTLLMAFAPCLLWAQKAEVSSPDNAIRVVFNADGHQMTYDVLYNGRTVLAHNRLGLSIDGKALPAKVKGQKVTRRHQVLDPVVPIKFSHIEKDYNELTLTMQGGYSILWRAYNDGIAYRFVTKAKGEVNVDDETIVLGVRPDYLLHIQQDDKFTSAYENPYIHTTNTEWTVAGQMACLPLLIDADGCKILFSEADHYDYPRAFLKHAEDGLEGTFSKAWIGEKKVYDRYTAPLEYAPYIARTQGSRNFPWRYMVIAGRDEQLVENTMNACLSSAKCEIDDTSWIRPGQVSWDWWNGKAVYGPDVNFKCGINTDTYKYYIDFASKYGIPYIILDEGWNVEVNRPYDVIDGLDIHELIRYGEERGVGLILWVTWYAVYKHPDIFERYAEWGVKGMKIDFMERSDQGISQFYENTVREAAKHHLVVDFHGAYTPAGLEYRYPNLLAYEGVRGMENNDRCLPSNSMYFPFIRNAVGAMDYTPGAMLSVHHDQRATYAPNAMSIGTRAYQLALFITCETGTQMLGDSPTQYYRNPDCTEFITQVPVTWDETRALRASSGEYAVIAKRRGHKWYLAGLTNDKPRDLEVALDFLTPGRTYTMTAFSDGINADYQAMDYRRTQQEVTAATTLPIRMVRNGGFAAVITDLEGFVADGVESMLGWRVEAMALE